MLTGCCALAWEPADLFQGLAYISDELRAMSLAWAVVAGECIRGWVKGFHRRPRSFDGKTKWRWCAF